MARREFTVANAHVYNMRSPVRWIISHVLRYPLLPIASFFGNACTSGLYSLSALLIGRAFDLINTPGAQISELANLALLILATRLGVGLVDLARVSAVETLAQRLERDAREELYISLLGKSQTFHNRQQTGDIMARATNDMQQLSMMINPGAGLIAESVVFTIVPLISIATLRLELLLVPLVFLVTFVIALRRYSAALNPVTGRMWYQYGVMNAGLAESISGIEVVKGYAQEQQERARFSANARGFRDLFIREGQVKARYLPLLLYGIAFGLSFGHALLLFQAGVLTVGQVVAFMGLIGVLRFPTFISLFTFSLVQMGLAGARRILELIKAETELDENAAGIARPIAGALTFENVSFGYHDEAPARTGVQLNARTTTDHGPPTTDSNDKVTKRQEPVLNGVKDDKVTETGEPVTRSPVHPFTPSAASAVSPQSPALSGGEGSVVLQGISFQAQPGETIAIVGQTGAGKSTLTQLVNRTYDVSAGRVLIDGVDVREWSLQSLRSQISTIEQDIFLFSRTIAENIAFGAAGQATREQIEQAAREAQAHEFIMSFPDGYDTIVGERGVTLSGGQRQRIAIARAFLTNPRILILDDSTSAIDSATEDQIQRAMRGILHGRTTLLITHRISQIRWADRILVLRRGELVAQGSHEELLATSEAYRRIFARYEREDIPENVKG